MLRFCVADSFGSSQSNFRPLTCLSVYSAVFVISDIHTFHNISATWPIPISTREKHVPLQSLELLPKEASINITPPLHPRAAYLSLFIISSGPFFFFTATDEWVRDRPVCRAGLVGKVSPPEQQASLGVSGWGGEKNGQTKPSEACLIVAEFPVGVTLKKHPQEESWDVRKTFSGSICWGELRLCAQGHGQILCGWNTVTPLLLRLKDRPVQHIPVSDSNAHYLLLWCKSGCAFSTSEQ